MSRKEPVSREPVKVSKVSSKVSKTEVPKPASMPAKAVEPAPVREKVVRRPAQVKTESLATARPAESMPPALIQKKHPTGLKAAAVKKERTEPLLVKEKREAPVKLEATAQKPRPETGQTAQLQTPSKAVQSKPKGMVKAAPEPRPKIPVAAAKKKSDSIKESSPASVMKQPEPIKKSPPPRQRTRLENLVSEYRRAIKLDPSNTLAYLKLGNIFFFEMNDLGQAQGMYSKVLEIDPDNKLGHNNLGVVFLKQNSFDRAETEFRAALEIDPAYADAQYNRACLSARRGQKIEAMARLLRAAQIDPAVHLWAADDEDLRSLKDMPEFKRFIRQPKTDNNEAKKE
ncbi:MAG: tetratricopeptide repeat protein, partial [Candidatus Adiutricales bacterium]